MTLSLSRTDQYDPDALQYDPRGVPVVIVPAERCMGTTCGCLGNSASADVQTQSAFSFSFNPPWDPNWTLDEIRKEECRRICWSALTLIASHTSQCAAFHEEPLRLQLAEPSNVRDIEANSIHKRIR